MKGILSRVVVGLIGDRPVRDVIEKLIVVGIEYAAIGITRNILQSMHDNAKKRNEWYEIGKEQGMPYTHNSGNSNNVVNIDKPYNSQGMLNF